MAREREWRGEDPATLTTVEMTRGTRTRSGAGIGAPAQSYVWGKYIDPPSDVEEEEEEEEDESEEEAEEEVGEEASEEGGANGEAGEEGREELGGEALTE